MSALALTRESNVLPSKADWAVMLEMADALVKSGMLPAHIKTPQAAVAIIQKGRELGIPPMHALSNIVNIQGKPTANAELMLALIYRDHGDAAVRFGETSAQQCHIFYKRRNWPSPLSFAFTIEDARTAQLADTPNWKKYPAAMLRARCISAVARMAFPDSIGGMYTPEELGASVVITSDMDVVMLGAGAAEDRHLAALVDPETGEIQDETANGGEVEAAFTTMAERPMTAANTFPATENQITRIAEAALAAGWGKEDLLNFMRQEYATDNRKKLTLGQADAFIAYLVGQQPPAEQPTLA